MHTTEYNMHERRSRMQVGITTTYVISAYHHYRVVSSYPVHSYTQIVDKGIQTLLIFPHKATVFQNIIFKTINVRF